MSLAGNIKHNQPNWDVFDELFATYTDLTNMYYSEFDDLIKIWDRELSEFGQDPTHTDWTKFRPLRLSREEDWSDWLAYLIETSSTGIFCKVLLDIPEQKQSAYALPLRVDREVSHDEYRADIVVQWTNHNYTHIEVKVGDKNLAKTGATASRMRAHYQQSEQNWTNFILMLSEQLSDWDSSDNNQPDEPNIKTITWADVSIALRRALRSEETLLWRSWAYSYLGAVEQHLVRFSGHRLKTRPIENLDRKIQIMKMGLENEPTNG